MNAGRLRAGGAATAVVALAVVAGNIVVGVAVISLLSGVGRSAVRPVDVPRPGRPLNARREPGS